LAGYARFPPLSRRSVPELRGVSQKRSLHSTLRRAFPHFPARASRKPDLSTSFRKPLLTFRVSYEVPTRHCFRTNFCFLVFHLSSFSPPCFRDRGSFSIRAFPASSSSRTVPRWSAWRRFVNSRFWAVLPALHIWRPAPR